MVYNMVLIVPVFFDVAAKVDLHALLRHLLQPNFSTRQPEVRQLRLPAVDQFLAEDAIFIAERIPHRGIPLCGQAIQETRRQTAKAAVSQRRVMFLGLKGFIVNPQLVQRFFNHGIPAQVIDVGF